MNSKIRNVVAATGLAGSLLIGGVSIAAAQTSTTKPATGSNAAPAAPARPDRTTQLKAALAPLVTKGTITQAQADAVAAALAANDGGMGGRGGHGGPGGMGMGGPMANHADTIAKALGISTTDLQTALQSGKTIAQVATEKGVAVQKVIDAFVAEEKQEHPEMTAADVTTRVTAMVNGQAPVGGPGGGRGGHGPRGGNGTTGAPAAAANSTGTTVKA